MIAALAVLAMVFVAGAVLIEESSDVDASTSYIQGDTAVIEVNGTSSFQIMYFETEAFSTLSINYTAVLNNSDGNVQSNAVSPSTGSLTNGVESTLVITAPAYAGKYTLLVTFKVIRDGGEAENIERTQTIAVVEPIVLRATLLNNNNLDFTDFAVYFKVFDRHGNLIDEGDDVLVSVAAGSTTSVSYNLVKDSLPNGRYTFQVEAGTDNIGGQTTFDGGEGSFYVGGSNYGLFDILLFILLIVLVIAVIYFYRKPVKNYGKPKSRR